MNDALRRRALDKGCTDIMYVTIEYPNYPIISLLTQPRGNCVNVLRLWHSSFHFGTWTRILTIATQCVTIGLRRPFWILKLLFNLTNHSSLSINFEYFILLLYRLYQSYECMKNKILIINIAQFEYMYIISLNYIFTL